MANRLLRSLRSHDAGERIIRARSQYYYKRSLGVSCRDLRTESERDRFEQRHEERLRAAWAFVETLAGTRGASRCVTG